MMRLALLPLLAALFAVEPGPAQDRRVPWTTSKVVGSPDPPLPFVTRPAFPKLSWRHPLYITFEPTTGRMITVTQHGRLYSFPNDPAVEKSEIFFEHPNLWFYSIMFHPKYAE